ncbi:hypothetical protein B9Z65_7285 [Elsinoe australis]|uniref:Rhodopsin domain-containing protein n=1 Tax=Elsinoe australis TaxID=40998 RepID=A0A2P7Z6F1_9PEZI|nr:hypothetical protein B9Z65_7285 [Elsinoe australis]
MSFFKIDRAAILRETAVVEPIAYTFLGLATALGLLRFYTGIRILRQFGKDDYFMVLALISFITYGSLFLYSVHISTTFQKTGRFLIKISDILRIARWTTAMFAVCIIFVKLSVAFFMERLYGPHNRWQRWTVWTATTLVTLLGFVYAIMAVASCAVANIPGVKCSTVTAYNDVLFTWSLLNSVVDVLFAAMSIILVSKLTIKGAAAVSTAILLLLGTVGGIASGIRCAVLLGWKTGDATTDSFIVGRWSLLEVGLTISAACLATLRPWLRMLQGKDGSSRDYHDRTSQLPTNGAASRVKSQTKVRDGQPGLYDEDDMTDHGRRIDEEVALSGIGPKVTHTVQIVHV